jgi:hypothetical protein
LTNLSLSEEQEAELAAYAREGGTIVAIGEHEGGTYNNADYVLNNFARLLGVGLALKVDSYDNGPHVTYNIGSSPLMAGVFSLGDNWVSSVTVSGNAEALAEVQEGPGVLVGEQSVGNGRFVMAGDSNLFSDDNEGFYAEDGNGQFVANMCP